MNRHYVGQMASKPALIPEADLWRWVVPSRSRWSIEGGRGLPIFQLPRL